MEYQTTHDKKDIAEVKSKQAGCLENVLQPSVMAGHFSHYETRDFEKDFKDSDSEMDEVDADLNSGFFCCASPWWSLFVFSITSSFNAVLFALRFSAEYSFAYMLNPQTDVTHVLYYSHLLMNVLLTLPTAILLSIFGVHKILFVSTLVNLVSAGMKLTGVCLGKYQLDIAAQFVANISSCLYLVGSVLIASFWFPVNLRSMATCLGLYSRLFGISIGTIMSVNLIPDYRGETTSIDIFGASAILGKCCLAVLFSSLCLVGLVFFTFLADRNDTKKVKRSSIGFRQSLSYLSKSLYFNVTVQVYAIHYGLLVASLSLLSAIIRKKLPFVYRESSVIGIVWLISIFASLPGTLLCARLFDRYKIHRVVAVTLSLLSLLSSANFFAFSSEMRASLAVLGCYIAYGLVFIPHTCSALYHVCDSARPVMEEASCGVAILVANVYAFTFTSVFGILLKEGHLIVMAISVPVLYFVATMLSFVENKDENRRARTKGKAQS